MSKLKKGDNYMECQLQKILQHQGRKQSWLRSELGVSDATLHRWIKGDNKIPLEQMYRIKQLLGLDSIEELYKEE